jgi:hypothetical protein
VTDDDILFGFSTRCLNYNFRYHARFGIRTLPSAVSHILFMVSFPFFERDTDFRVLGGSMSTRTSVESRHVTRFKI